MAVSSATKAGKARLTGATPGRSDTLGMPVDSRLAIEHAITRVLDQSESIAQAMPEVIRVICEALGWACGARWRAGATAADMRCTETWGIDAPVVQAFLEVTRRHEPAQQPGGLIGRVWAERKPIWLRDVTQEPGFRRAAAAAAAGLHSAFAFPIRAEAQVIGVMEFFSREARQPDFQLLEGMNYVGSQLGQFTRRKEAEAVLRDNEEHFRSLTELSADFYWETDRAHRLLRTRHGHMHRPLTRDGRQFGRARWELPSTYPDDAGWADHRARLDEHLPFRDFEFARIDDEGVERYLSISGEPIFDSSGAFAGYRGIGKDITARKREDGMRRESEARFRNLTALSSDWYWEQDENFRFTLVSNAAKDKSPHGPASRLGETRWDRPALNMSEADWAAHRAVLEAHQPFHDLELHRRGADGKSRYTSISGEPMFDAEGRFKGYRGIGKDITQRKRDDELRELEHSVTRCLAEAESPSAALQSAIEAICKSQGWECGRYFYADEKAGLLRFGDAWGIDDAAIQRYIEGSRAYTSPLGRGSKAQVWRTGEAVWNAETSRHGQLVKSILDSARDSFVFAVSAEGKSLGVLSFTSRALRKPDERLLQATRVIGSQIGQFLKRKHAEDVLRESEERFRSLTQLSSDFYWQTDAEHRLVRTVHGGGHRPLTKHGSHFGKARWDIPYTWPAADGWAAHRATMERHEPFRDFEYARINDEGVERYLSISGEPSFDASGAFLGYRGVGKDITARKREEQLLNLEHTVARSLSEAADRAAGLTAVLRAVCEANGWDCGRYFLRDEQGVLRFAESWHVPGKQLERFIVYSQGLTFATGAGIVGLAGAGETIWVEDIGTDPRMVSKTMATEHGMRGAFMFPVLAEGAIIGVLSFTSREIRKPEERLLSAARMIGSQVGQFLKRRHAEQVLRKSEENFRALTELSSDIYWAQDAEHRFTAFTGSQKTVPSRLIGKCRWDEGALNMTEADWAAHKAVMDAHQTFRDMELKRKSPTGEIFWVAISGSPVFDEAGRFVGYRGISRNITARKRAEQLRTLEHTVTRALAAANSASEVLRAAIRAVCETEGWECGRFFAPEGKSAELRMKVAWGVQDEAVQRYIAGSRNVTYAAGVGIAGRVWQSGEPLWIADLYRDARVSQKGLAQASGMHGAFVFPVIADGRTIGVLAFNSREPREPEESLLQAIRVIGIQIGQFVQRKQAEEVVRESEERFRSLTTLSSDLYWEQDEEFRFTTFSGIGSERVNPKSLPMLGKKRWEQNYVNMSADDWAKHIALLEEHKPFRDMELCRLDDKGEKVWISIAGEPVFDAVGKFRGYRGVGKDITHRKRDEERIQYLANHDALTALPNRAMFGELLTLSLHHAKRYGRNFAVLFVDLDRFKVINDTLGHEAGDNLLKEVGERLKRTVRASDVVGRLGGDEFVIMVQEVSEAQQVEVVARKVLSALMKPVYIQGQEYRITASIGICMYPADAQDEQAIMKNADIAMYRAKEEGKNTYKFYSAKSNSHSFERLALETSLRLGLERNEFLLHYQAKVDLHTGEITGVEALVRWQHPDLGMVPPGQFIPLAEETGLIVPLGKWVLGAACAQNMAWQREGLPPLRMSVNISARQFTDENLLKDIAEALESSGMPAQLLELELTESMVMQNAERAAGVLAAIKKMGARLAIDDFGVGYSSLTHLKRFPIDTLKVDRSFIRDIPQDTEDKAITEAIIAMGKSLNLTVVAEGVETLEQQNFLKEHDCDEMQGYYFAKPMQSDKFAELLRKRVG